jgi:tetratricopeptide (TPR) repeat protein
MWDLAVREEAFEEIDAMLARFRGRPPLSLRLLPTLARSDDAGARVLLEEGRNLESRQLQTAARYIACFLENLPLADSIAQLDVAWRQRPANRATAQLLLAGLAAAGGRWSLARNRFETAETMEGAGQVLVPRSFVATVPMLPVPAADLRIIRDEIERWNATEPGEGPGLVSALQPHLRLYLMGLLSNRLGDVEGARRALSALERLELPPQSSGVGPALRATLRADLALAQQQPRDALTALEGVKQEIPLELLSLSRAAHLRPYGNEYARYLRAVALSALGRHTEALAWLRFGLRGAPQEYLYHAPMHIRLGEVFEQLQRADSAAAHYGKFLELWSQADPEAGPLVEDIRARVTRLGARPHP